MIQSELTLITQHIQAG